ncbi:MAG TPA: DUF523 domain-containing protein [Gammaproteobacteria bacterium]|nr:DUF523 domain-containing protein [Gammaproteobacteria bacterium]
MNSAQADSDRPVVAISSCLLGENVRYDGRHKQDACIAQYFSDRVDWKPICPEVGAGLDVPRPAVRLVGDKDRPRALGVEDASLDVTDTLVEYAREMFPELQGVNGYIFKCRSPSCGLTDTPLFSVDGHDNGFGSGIYARGIIAALPDLPVIDEQQLLDAQSRDLFMQQVLSCWQRQKAGVS